MGQSSGGLYAQYIWDVDSNAFHYVPVGMQFGYIPDVLDPDDEADIEKYKQYENNCCWSWKRWCNLC